MNPRSPATGLRSPVLNCGWILGVLFQLATAVECVARHDERQGTGDEGRRTEVPTVGIARRIDGLVLPGSELVAKPLKDARSPIVLRIIHAAKHGTAFRYDIVYHGLEPGSYDLRAWLERKDASTMDGVPPIPVEIRPAYDGKMKQVSDIDLGPVRLFGGYRTLLWALGAAWAIGLAALLVAGRRKTGAAVAVVRPLTMADRLRPLVEKAARGEITQDEQAELERTLIGFWRRREGLDREDVATALAELRRRESSGELLRALEAWLHRPGGGRDVDVAKLLAPYAKEQA